MADLTKVQQLRNDGAVWLKTAGAASQTMVYDRSDDMIILLVENGDAAACRIKVSADGFGAGFVDLDVDIAAGEFAVIGPLESNRFKDPSTQKVTFEILDQDNTAFSGTVTNVLLTQLNAPISLTN
jgi:hypothetical protein